MMKNQLRVISSIKRYALFSPGNEFTYDSLMQRDLISLKKNFIYKKINYAFLFKINKFIKKELVISLSCFVQNIQILLYPR